MLNTLIKFEVEHFITGTLFIIMYVHAYMYVLLSTYSTLMLCIVVYVLSTCKFYSSLTCGCDGGSVAAVWLLTW